MTNRRKYLWAHPILKRSLVQSNMYANNETLNMSTLKHSGLQKQILSLYRDCLRHARTLAPESRTNAQVYIRHEFREKAHAISKMDFQRIEFLLRQGRKKLKSLENSSVSAFDFSTQAPK